jgi:predicted dehydrogenase
MTHYKWGIVGTGRIAELFSSGLGTLDRARLFAVASRDIDTAKAFQSAWDFQIAYGSYAELYDDPDVEIIYIATPHAFHFQNAKDALLAGKHVLCEKPFTLNARQARELAGIAHSRKLFLMEAMWNRFQPWYGQVKKILDHGELGTLHHFKADLSFHFPFDPEHRLYNPHLGGGALLDLGVYPISLASLVFGKPARLQCEIHRCETGVDDQVSAILSYSAGATAEVACSTRFTSKNNATLHGSKGFLEIEGMIIRPQKLKLHLYAEENDRVILTPTEHNAYQYQAQAAMDMLDNGAIEHPLMPLRETIEIMETMDIIRQRAGIVYPGE